MIFVKTTSGIDDETVYFEIKKNVQLTVQIIHYEVLFMFVVSRRDAWVKVKKKFVFCR